MEIIRSIPPSLQGIGASKICLACLACMTSNTLSCGHELCDSCMSKYAPIITNARTVLLATCLFCGEPNDVVCRLRPHNAGVRVLVLEGDVQNARSMSIYLKSIRSILTAPMGNYFDLVIGSNIGIFFAVMLFCQGASVEDCIHHLRGLKWVKIHKNEIRFGPGLNFPFKDIRTKGPKLCLYHRGRLITMVEKSTSSRTEEWLRKSFRPRPADTGFQVNALVSRLWPEASIDVSLQYSPAISSHLDGQVESLIGSLFYIDIVEPFHFYSDTPIEIELRIGCHIEPGPYLTSLLMALRRKKTRIHYRGDNPLVVADLCSDQSWREVKEGKDFLTLLTVTASSPSSMIMIMVDSMRQEGQVNISNSPCRLGNLQCSREGATGISQTSGIRSVIATISSLQEALQNMN